MAWLYKQEESDMWWIGHRLNGKQVRKSTGTGDEAEAKKRLAQIEAMEAAQRAGRLTEAFYRELTGNAIVDVTIKAAVADWQTAIAGSVAPSTAGRYKDVLEQFMVYLQANPVLRNVGTDELDGFLSRNAKTHSKGSIIVTRKILSAFWNWAVKAKKATENPVRATKRPKAQKGEKVNRRAFTMDELKLLWTNAPDDFWKYMICAGLYTGLRMGDLICLEKSEVDLAQNIIKLDTRKTGADVEIPIGAPLRAILEKLVKNCRGKYLWPAQAEYYLATDASPFSQDFYELVMVKAGLVPKRSHAVKKKGVGHRQRHQLSAVSFHCLRHTFVSMLKTSGCSQAVAKELAAHASDKISDMYTHVAPEHMRAAIKLLPDVTAEAA